MYSDIWIRGYLYKYIDGEDMYVDKLENERYMEISLHIFICHNDIYIMHIKMILRFFIPVAKQNVKK